MIRIAATTDASRLAELSGVSEDIVVQAMERMTMLIDDHGGFFLEPITPSVFEAHMFFEPESRGKYAISSAKSGLKIAFDVMSAAVVFGRIPVEDRAARLLTRLIGFISSGVRPKIPDGPLVEWFEMRSPYLCRP